MCVKRVGGCVKYVVVGACVWWDASVCVCRDSCVCQCVCFDRDGYTDVISYQTDVVDLQSNSPAPPNMALFPNYCTSMFLLCFYLHDNSFLYKPVRFFIKGKQLNSGLFSQREMPLKRAVCPVLLTPSSINIIFFLRIHQAEVKLDFIASTAEL